MKNSYLCIIILFLSITSCKNNPNQKEEGIDATNELVVQVKGTFEDLDGNSVELSDYKGKRVLLNYWATWCRPCIEEMPALLSAQKVLSKEGYVFLLASDQATKKIKAFKDKKKFDFTFLKFNGAMADMKINALPATFIYNEAGKMVDRVDGATEWDSPKVIDKLKAIK